MLLGLLSDTHDDIPAINEAFQILEAKQVDLIIHCGDFISPETFIYFVEKARSLEIPVKAVVGNNETPENIREIRLVVESGEYPVDMSHDAYDLTFEIGGLECALCHGHDGILLESLVSSADYDVIFRGHTHQPLEQRIGSTQVINPGACCHKTLGAPTKERGIAIYDTSTRQVDFIPLD